MRTVLATSHTPTLGSGRAMRTYAIVRALAARDEVDLVYMSFGAAEPDPAYGALAAVRLHPAARPSLPARLPAYLRARLAAVPGDFARGIWPALPRLAAELAGGAEETRLIADGPVAAAALLPLAGRRPAIYSAHNLESAFRHRLAESGMSRRSLERFERLLLERYAESWMVSPADTRRAAALAPGARLRLVPNVVDVAAIHPVPSRDGRRTVLFLADLTYEPNREALRFLLEEALPRLWRSAPDVRLVVAGKGSEGVDAGDPRVEARGFVAELPSLYGEAGCVAVPLLEGGGSPLKFVEALAFGVPVVATPLAAAGLEAEAAVHYVEASPDGESFARGVLEALEPGRGTDLGAAGRALAEREYSLQALERRLAP